ncbi:MAG TPA: hypothetical protein VLT84_13070 [Acidobacteriota bacterium]|nr:hypothetical protein [Acidobacteriota bacterium]
MKRPQGSPRTGRAAIAATAAALLLLLAIPASARDIVVTGRVLKGMEHKPLPGQNVTLHIVRGSEELPGTTKKTDKDGTVLFDKIPEGEGLEYYLATEFEGAFYTEGPIRPGPDGSLKQTILVFDVGKEIDKVSVSNHHIIIERDSDGLNVNEILIIENAGETSYLGIGADHAQNAGMRLGLPASIKAFTPGVGADEGTLIVQGREMMSLRPIPPGQRPLSFTYKVPLSGRIDLSHRFYYPTKTFVVMIDDASMKLESKALTYAGSREQGGKKYEMYTGTDLAMGSELEIRVQGASFWSNPAIYPWLAVPFLVAGVLFTARRLSRQAPRPAPAGGAGPSAVLGAPAPQAAPRAITPATGSHAASGDEDLAQTYAYLIAALDQGRERGEISADSHGLVRSNLKRRLELLVSQEPASRGR